LAVLAAADVSTGSLVRMPVISVKEPWGATLLAPRRTISI
jgi:hypothetical protein